MDYRGVLLIGILGGAGLAFATSSCSAPDPWQVTFSERPRGQRGDLTSGGSVTPTDGGDNGGADAAPAGPITAFSNAPAYDGAGTANGSSQNASHPNGGNPAGVNCMDCHVTGGAGAAGGVWGFAGTVYDNATGTNPVAKAEVRVVDAAGKELAKVYSDALGNFWADTIVGGLPPGSKVGVRNATATKLMATALAPADAACQRAGCHVVGTQGRVYLQ